MNTLLSVLREQQKKIDPKLLIFLVLLLNVKLLVKLLAIVLIYLLQPDFKFAQSFKKSGFGIFYAILLGLAIFNALMNGLFGIENYWAVFLLGTFGWAACFLVTHQLRVFAEKLSQQKLENTLAALFLLNAAVSIAVLISIIFETGHFNPYQYQGNFQKYFINTGDYIKGVSFDTSTTNAALNGMGMIYFFYRKNWMMLMVCLFILVLAGSNLVNMLVLLTLAFLLLFKSTKLEKSIIFLCVLPFIIFWAKVSPQNNEYIASYFKKNTSGTPAQNISKKPPVLTQIPDNELNPDQLKKKTAILFLDSVGKKMMDSFHVVQINASSPVLQAALEKKSIPKPDIHTSAYQHKDDSNKIKKEWIQFALDNQIPQGTNSGDSRIPGKIKAIKETLLHLKKDHFYSLTGMGMGNFSSRLAFKVSGLGIAGSYPASLAYINPDFEINHLKLHLSYFTKQEKLHSVVNTPNSVFDQLLSEYGIAGMLAFFIFYAGFILKRSRCLRYGLPLLILMLGLFFTDYWFELLSVVVVFELLIYTDFKTITDD
ncbi:MAG: hypothetical protein H0U44_10645 [Flavisolibacter sp.]|jgi:hypothetical protein|nr:hypothetical protein [Flavisolibacter sp.]